MSLFRKRFYAPMTSFGSFLEAVPGAVALRRAGQVKPWIASRDPAPMPNLDIYHETNGQDGPRLIRFNDWNSAVAATARSSEAAQRDLQQIIAEQLVRNETYRARALQAHPDLQEILAHKTPLHPTEIEACLNGSCPDHVLARLLAAAPPAARCQFIEKHFTNMVRQIRQDQPARFSGDFVRVNAKGHFERFVPEGQVDGYMVGNARNHSVFVHRSYAKNKTKPIRCREELQILVANKQGLDTLRADQNKVREKQLSYHELARRLARPPMI